ncbi:hypothetical protein V1511DRAFT_493409 [Dipodascopsis uninucleata]
MVILNMGYDTRRASGRIVKGGVERREYEEMRQQENHRWQLTDAKRDDDEENISDLTLNKSRRSSLMSLPDELFSFIILNLDFPDILSVAQTTRRLRRLALDHYVRRSLFWVKFPSFLGSRIVNRPSEAELLSRSILRSPTRLSQRFHAAASNLRISFTKNALSRKLARRPELGDLIQRGVYPVIDARVNPAIAQRCKILEREKVRNSLERELSHGAWASMMHNLRARERHSDEQESVHVLIRRFTRKRESAEEINSNCVCCRNRSLISNNSVRAGDANQISRSSSCSISSRSASERLQMLRFGLKKKKQQEDPTRAKVYRLRMFFERISRQSDLFNGTGATAVAVA